MKDSLDALIIMGGDSKKNGYARTKEAARQCVLTLDNDPLIIATGGSNLYGAERSSYDPPESLVVADKLETMGVPDDHLLAEQDYFTNGLRKLGADVEMYEFFHGTRDAYTNQLFALQALEHEPDMRIGIVSDSDCVATHTHLARKLSARHVFEPIDSGYDGGTLRGLMVGAQKDLLCYDLWRTGARPDDFESHVPMLRQHPGFSHAFGGEPGGLYNKGVELHRWLAGRGR